MNVTIIGLGLIGGSIGKRIVSRGGRVTFLDPAINEREAVDAGAAHASIGDLADVPSGDLVILATPVDIARRLLATYRQPNEVVTVCSVLGPFSDLARVSALQLTPSHPMAGSEQSGLTAANANLFSGKNWFVAGRGSTALQRLISMCEAVAVSVDAEEHDRAMAYVSHLPQLLSTALAAVIGDAEIDVEMFAGTGLRSVLRLAGSTEDVWRPIFDANSEHLEAAATDLIERVEGMLTGSDSSAFASANTVAARLKGR